MANAGRNPRRFAHVFASLLAAGLLLTAAGAADAQRVLYGRWQARIGDTAARLTIITVDGDGWIHGTLYYDPPLDGFAGAPFTTQISGGAFAIRFANGTRYDDMHWCRTTLCGTHYTRDETAVPVVFARSAAP